MCWKNEYRVVYNIILFFEIIYKKKKKRITMTIVYFNTVQINVNEIDRLFAIVSPHFIRLPIDFYFGENLIIIRLLYFSRARLYIFSLHNTYTHAYTFAFVYTFVYNACRPIKSEFYSDRHRHQRIDGTLRSNKLF